MKSNGLSFPPPPAERLTSPATTFEAGTSHAGIIPGGTFAIAVWVEALCTTYNNEAENALDAYPPA